MNNSDKGSINIYVSKSLTYNIYNTYVFIVKNNYSKGQADTKRTEYKRRPKLAFKMKYEFDFF